MKKIFISYAHNDIYFKVDELINTLKESNYEIIWDQGIIEIGDHLINQIKKSISDCDYVLSILTPISYQRPWVIRELHEALLQEQLRGKKVLLPIVIGGLNRSQIAEIDSYLGWLRTDPYLKIIEDASKLDSLIKDLNGLGDNAAISNQNFSFFPILEDNLNIYRTNDLIAFGLNEKNKYVRTVDSYILIGFDKGKEFKHIVKCNENDVLHIKNILGQYKEIYVSGVEPFVKEQSLCWFLDKRYDITSKLNDPYCNNIFL
jgi:hypothetical protein